jgi:uncharacterized protein
MLRYLRAKIQPATWPNIDSVLPPSRRHKKLEQLKYTGRLLLARRHLNRLTQSLTQLPVWADLYQAKPHFFLPPLSSFLDRRWSIRQRYTQLSIDLHAAHTRFGEGICRQIATAEGLVLCSQDNAWTVTLNANPLNIKEGHWALTMNDALGQQVFNLSFGFLDPTTVLIASLQGGSKTTLDSKERIYQLTKQCFGLRPQQLLFNIAQMLCQGIGVQQLLGIDRAHHIYSHWYATQQKVKFDYGAFWQAMGGTFKPNRHTPHTSQTPNTSNTSNTPNAPNAPNARGRSHSYWVLPLVPNHKPIDTVASNKRSQYKKRYAWLAQVQAQVAQALLSFR